jgi:excisionase family DNA binding protein
MSFTTRLLYTIQEAAHMLSLSRASLDLLIERGEFHVKRKGNRVMLHIDEIQAFAKRDTPTIWPPKVNGKTTRHAERP